MRERRRGELRVCGRCGRVSKEALARNYCQVTLWNISPNKCADKCKFFTTENLCDAYNAEDRRRRDELKQKQTQKKEQGKREKRNVRSK